MRLEGWGLGTVATRLRVTTLRTQAAGPEPFVNPQFAIRNSQSLSLHQVGLLETLLMARQLGCAPEEVVIFGIVPKDMSPGLELSEEVAAVVPKVVELVLAELRR